MSDISVDLAVIGSGGGAFAAAIRASALGKSVAMIERGTMGGTCVNTGCVPSKALIAAAEARHVALDTRRFPGITAAAGRTDMARLIDGKDALVGQLRQTKYLDIAAGHGWRLLHGEASFGGSPEAPVVRVSSTDGTTELVQAEHYLIATGGRPTEPAIEGLDQVDYLTSTTAMELAELPESMLVLGGGYVALEQAQLFARLGSRVTMLVRSRLASREEPEADEVLGQVFADEGIQVVRDVTVERVHTDPVTGKVIAATTVMGEHREFTADRLLVAVGRTPNTESLNLPVVGVDTGQDGRVIVSEQLATANPRVWAAGDVTAQREFVYVAAAHGALVVDNAFTGAGRAMDYSQLPRVTFTSPALGAVGMTDAQAVAAGIRCDCRVLPLDYVPRAIVNRDTRGFIKVVADADTGRILGITAVARDAGELAAAGVYILATGMTTEQVASTWAPYLTMAEGIKLACQAYTTDVSQLSCCAS